MNNFTNEQHMSVKVCFFVLIWPFVSFKVI